MGNMSYNYYVIIITVFFTFWMVMVYNCALFCGKEAFPIPLWT